MINSLKLENYRGFEEYEIDSLGRVNLLVGDNNCGKTSILEGLFLLTLGNPLHAFHTIAMQRGEVVVKQIENKITNHPQITHFFRGHELAPEIRLSVSSDSQSLTAQVNNSGKTEKNQKKEGMAGSSEDWMQTTTTTAVPTMIFDEASVLSSLWDIQIDYSGRKIGLKSIGRDGALTPDLMRRYRLSFQKPNKKNPALYIPPDSLNIFALKSLWNKAVLEGQESDLYDILRIIQPDLSRLVFLSEIPIMSIPVFGNLSRAGFFALLKDYLKPIPLGSLGGGSNRLLALALSLNSSRNGFLLIDEVDSGLHHSKMGELWRLLVVAAQKANIQVFCTTHSQDCVNGLRWLCANFPELKKEVALHSIDHPRLKKAITSYGDEIVKTIDLGIEVR